MTSIEGETSSGLSRTVVPASYSRLTIASSSTALAPRLLMSGISCSLNTSRVAAAGGIRTPAGGQWQSRDRTTTAGSSKQHWCWKLCPPGSCTLIATAALSPLKSGYRIEVNREISVPLVGCSGRSSLWLPPISRISFASWIRLIATRVAGPA